MKELLNEKTQRVPSLNRCIPIVSLSLISLLILCFFYQTRVASNNLTILAYHFSISREAIHNSQLLRLITANFFHVNLGHLLSNIFGLLLFCSSLEIILGRTRIIIVILLSAIGGTIGSVMFNIVEWMVGSSTILFGVFGGLGVLILKYRREINRFFITAAISWFISLILLSTLGYISLERVDQGAHIGGIISGILSTSLIVNQKRISLPSFCTNESKL